MGEATSSGVVMFSVHLDIYRIMERPIAVGDAMQTLIDAHVWDCSDGNCEPYRHLPYDDEAARLARHWFPAVIEDEPPVLVPVRGLLFGLLQ